MSDALSEAKSFLKAVRTTLAVAGTIMLVLGLFILIAPTKTAMFFAGFIAAYLIIQGLVYIGTGISSKEKGGWSRVGHIALGLLYVVGGILAFVNLFAFTATLMLFLGIMIGIAWIVDGVVSLSLLGDNGSKVWTVIYAILSIVAGVIMLFSPLFAAVVIWWIIGISLVVLGVLQIIRAITLGRDAKRAVAEIKQEIADARGEA
ncbi:MAG: DUF308 domain-containing protein [Microbacterium sp.]